MNWRPIADALLRYSLAWAGITVVAVALLTRSEVAVTALFFLGLVIVLVTMGIGDVRATDLTAGEASHETNHRAVIDLHTRLPIDGVLFFYGLGLVVLGFGGMVLVGSYLS